MQVEDVKWQLSTAEKRAQEYEHKFNEEVRKKPTGRIAQNERTATSVSARDACFAAEYLRSFFMCVACACHVFHALVGSSVCLVSIHKSEHPGQDSQAPDVL
jgi:hypothetical protein